MISEKLINKDLTELGRAADMLWLAIGKPLVIETDDMKKREVSEYAIHFQCQWRFVKDSEILLASHDIYNPYDIDLSYDDEWDWDVFGRENEKSNIFDVRSKELQRKFLPLKIEKVDLCKTSDLCITFENGICFSTFISCSRKDEYYRFIDFCTDEHTVIFDVD